LIQAININILPVNRIVATCGMYAKPFTSDEELAPRIPSNQLYYAITQRLQTTIANYLYPLLTRQCSRCYNSNS